MLGSPSRLLTISSSTYSRPSTLITEVTCSPSCAAVGAYISPNFPHSRTGTISDAEMREGVKEFGLQISEADLDIVSLYIRQQGQGDGEPELTLPMWKDFVQAANMEVAEAGANTFESVSPKGTRSSCAGLRS